LELLSCSGSPPQGVTVSLAEFPGDNHTIYEVDTVEYRYEDADALAGLSLSIKSGESVVLLGANGSGKSTLLKMLDGLIFPTAGNICVFGAELSEAALKDEGFSRSFRRSVGFVFQNSDAQLFSPTVRDEIAFGPLHMGLPPEEIEKRTGDTLHILGLEHLSERPPYHLSGGEKKKVALASVLAVGPDVLLFDEPTAGLDPKTESFLIRLILQLTAAGKTIITATQDLRLAAEIAGRIVVLGEDHKLAGDGPTAAILGDRELLLAANLIHDHPHRHDGIEHFHPHSHLKDHHGH